ncbi:MAG: hypothetical protein D6735_15730 [Acidobacteria bacterium]|nr:MAG: hypothetical protein D6735_15730 [Acidobacteriota bacterium]
MLDRARVKDAFAHLTLYKDDYIIYDKGKIVDYREAVRQFKMTGDDKWIMHILASNLGYFANSLATIVAKYKIDPADYVVHVYEGLKRSMTKCDATMVKLSYLSAGVFLWCRKQADLEVRERNKEAKIEEAMIMEGEDGEVVMIEDIDLLLAMQGLYELPLCDEDTR